MTPSSMRAERRERGRLARRAAAGDEVDDEIDHDRRQHRQQRRYDHFLDRGARQHVDGAAVIRLVAALHDARPLAELAPHFLDDRRRRASHRGHAHRAEQIRQQAAEQEAADHVGIGERKVRRNAQEVRMLLRARDEEFQVFVIGREQHQRAQAGRTDGIAFGHRLGGVADGVERVGRLAHFLRQTGHFGNAAGIVGHRSEGVERDDDTGQRQHGRHRDGDAEEAGEIIGDEDAGDDDERRQRGRLRATPQAPE